MSRKFYIKDFLNNSELRSTSQFNTDSLSLTHQFNTRTTPFQNQKSVSSTPKTLQINTLLSSTHPPVQHTLQFNTPFSFGVELTVFLGWTEGCVESRSVLNRGVCWTEGCVELKGFMYRTDDFLVFNWVVCWTEAFLCWTDGFGWLKRTRPLVLNCCVELRGVWNWGINKGSLPSEMDCFTVAPNQIE